jgi:hypothetical protein
MEFPKYTEEELKEYNMCPDILFIGAHLSGLTNCIYCSEIYRRYRKKDGSLAQSLNKGSNE